MLVLKKFMLTSKNATILIPAGTIPLIIPENAIVLSNDKDGLMDIFNIATTEIDKHLTINFRV